MTTTSPPAASTSPAQSDNILDLTPLTFGKYSGKTPNDVASIDPHWLVWAFNNVTNKPSCSKLLADECEKLPRKFKLNANAVPNNFRTSNKVSVGGSSSRYYPNCNE